MAWPRALEFLILTAARTGDIIGNDREDQRPTRWSHVDFRSGIWTVPKTKKIEQHRVPLSNQAIDILKPMKTDDETDKIGDDVETWVRECTNFRPMLLNAHGQRSSCSGYQRGDFFEKRKQLVGRFFR
jgi:integrase